MLYAGLKAAYEATYLRYLLRASGYAVQHKVGITPKGLTLRRSAGECRVYEKSYTYIK